MKNFKIGDRVVYDGIDVEFFNLENGQVYTVTSVNREGAIAINNSQLFFRPDQFTLDKEVPVISTKPSRKMKFSEKPGSAVVTYNTGETFHIGYLTGIEIVRDHPDADRLISVNRSYAKDGLLFNQEVLIPIEKFKDAVWVSPEQPDLAGQKIRVTYDPVRDMLHYSMAFLANEISFVG